VEAREKAYDGVELVQLEGSQFRTDIGRKAARGEIRVSSGATGSLPITKAKA
jgi:phosphoribosylamine--glycine ligase